MGHKVTTSVLCLLSLLLVSSLVAAQSQKGRQPQKYEPTIPSTSRYQSNKVFLERADSMVSPAASQVSNPLNSYIILKGNVEFSRADMHLYCDSAHFYDQTNSIDAFGHVRMDRADHLNGEADELHYNGRTEVMNLLGNVMLNKDTRTLTSEAIDYYVTTNTGEYQNGGKLDDQQNVLTSLVGTYNFNTDKAVFTRNVQLVSRKDNYVMNTTRLNYDSRTRVATLVEPTTITSNENRIETTSGEYNTNSEQATLLKKDGRQPKLFAKDGRTLTGDRIHYDRNTQEGYAEDSVTIVDEKNHIILTGGYGHHSEASHSSFVTRQALARIYNEEKARPGERSDTLYFHADTLRTTVEPREGAADSVRVLYATNGARFYRKDVQGLCGELVFSQADSVLNLYNHPVVWSEARQISSDNEINVHMRDSSSVDWATVPNKGLVVEHLGEIYYNQLSANAIKADFERNTRYFDDGTQRTSTELRHIVATGNVKSVYFPMENDSTYNKCVKTESGFLSIDLKEKQEIEKMKMWPDVTGTVLPLYTAKKSQMMLQEYQWFDDLRPRSPQDVMTIPAAMQNMISQPWEAKGPQSIKAVKE